MARDTPSGVSSFVNPISDSISLQQFFQLRIVKGVCDSMGADFELTCTQGYPVTINDAEMSELVEKCAATVVGEDRVVIPQNTMGGEDFSFFLQKAKGCFFALGTGRKGGASVHNPEFDFNEKILLTGVETFCRIALELLFNNRP